MTKIHFNYDSFNFQLFSEKMSSIHFKRGAPCFAWLESSSGENIGSVIPFVNDNHNEDYEP